MTTPIRTQLETSHWLTLGQVTTLLTSLHRDDVDKIVMGVMNLSQTGQTFEVGSHTWWAPGGPTGEISIRISSQTRPHRATKEESHGYDVVLCTENRSAVAAMAAAIWCSFGPSIQLVINGDKRLQAFKVAYSFHDNPLKHLESD